jgi:hypothetical protein
VKYSFTFTSAAPAPIACRSPVHGRHCKVPWGWDRDHTDQDRPYTLDELAARQDCPHFYAYPDEDGYVAGWRLWRALRVDSRLSEAEAEVKFQVLSEHIQERIRTGAW